MPDDPLFIGIDIGTSGARAVAIDRAGVARSHGRAHMAEFGTDPRDPRTWAIAVESAFQAVLAGVARAGVAALAVDGTSGTMVPVDSMGEPLCPGSSPELSTTWWSRWRSFGPDRSRAIWSIPVS